MKIININDSKLKIIDDGIPREGKEGIIYKCIYNGNLYALKILKNKNVIDNKVKKIELLSDRFFKLDEIVTSDFLVEKDNEIIAYLMPFVFGIDASKLSLPINVKISILKQLENLLKTTKANNVVCGDIRKNMIVNSKGILHLIDHDNFKVDDYEIDEENVFLQYYKQYVKKIDYVFDQYLFDLITLSFFSNRNMIDLFTYATNNCNRQLLDKQFEEALAGFNVYDGYYKPQNLLQKYLKRQY